jgi:hypothetical protein
VRTIEKLEALLSKIQARAAEPRVRRAEKPAPKPIMATVPFEISAAVVTPKQAPPIAIEPPPEPILVQQDFDEPIAVEQLPEPAVERASGEFEVAAPVRTTDIEIAEPVTAEEEMPLELEELGPADELEPGETVVEASSMPPAVALEAVPEEAREERISEPPASGRELVAAPYESARMPVAAPATPDPNALELEESHEPPPESSRNLKAAPAVPSTSEVVELQPLPVAERRPEPEPEEEAPVTVAPRTEPPPPPRPISEPPAPVQRPSEPPTLAFAKIASEPPPPRVATEPPPAAIAEPVEPIRAAVAVQLAPIARPVEHVVVAIDADVIKPDLTPSDVAAFVGAVREPRPASFGALLDAALDL